MSNAVMPLKDYVNACDTIREKTASSDLIKSGELADKVTDVYEAGKQAEKLRYWGALQNNGNRGECSYAFYGKGWNDSAYDPQFPFTKLHSVTMMYAYTLITDTKQPMAFVDNVLQSRHMFAYSSSIKTIRPITLHENVPLTNWFLNCTGLVDITINGVIGDNISFAQSTLLSKASQLSVFSHLSDNTTGLTLTLNKTAVDNAFETSESAADGSTSEEWLALVATKPNWTISLST